MRECDVGPCDQAAIIQVTGIAGRSWRTARVCGEHAQLGVDYCAKPVEQWRDDLVLVATYDHATREWVPAVQEVDADG